METLADPRRRRVLLKSVLLLCTLPPTVFAQSGLQDQLRAFTPSSIVESAERFPDRFGNPRPIHIVFVNADLDGAGKFNFFIVAYSNGVEWALRVLKKVDTGFQVAADVPPDSAGGARLELTAQDVDGDGLPEIVLKNFGVDLDYGLQVFRWTGTALRAITPEDGLGDAELDDIDGDGVLEAIVPPICLSGNRPQLNTPCEEGDEFEVYKLDPESGEFKLAFKSPTDPTNPTTATGQPQAVFAFRTVVMPSRFPLVGIQGAVAGQSSNQGVVTVRLGNLSSSSPGHLFAAVAATEVNLDSLVLGRNLHPLCGQVIPAETHDMAQQEVPDDGSPAPRGRFQGPFAQLEFSRQAVLNLIAKAQPTKPLAVGDKVTLEIKGRMNNGAPIEASVAVLVVGSPSK